MLFGGFIFLLYVGGFFVFAAIAFLNLMVSVVLKLLDVYDAGKSGAFLNIFFIIAYWLWYLFSLITVCRWAAKGQDK